MALPLSAIGFAPVPDTFSVGFAASLAYVYFTQTVAPLWSVLKPSMLTVFAAVAAAVVQVP